MKYRKSNNDGHIDNYCKSCDALEKQDMAMACAWSAYSFKFSLEGWLPVITYSNLAKSNLCMEASVLNSNERPFMPKISNMPAILCS